MRSFHVLVAILTTLLLLPTVRAQEPSFNFFQIDYRLISNSFDGDGWAGRVSYDAKPYYVFAAYGKSSFDDPAGREFDSRQWKAGLGIHGMLKRKGELFLGAGYTDFHRDGTGKGARLDDDGIFALAGVRYMALPRLELSATIERQLGDENLAVQVIGFFRRVGIGAEYVTFNEADESQIALLARFSKGRK